MSEANGKKDEWVVGGGEKREERREGIEADPLEVTAMLVYEINQAVRGCNGQAVGVKYGALIPQKKESLKEAIAYAWEREPLSEWQMEESHNRWTYAKLKEGWRFGAVEDSVEKTHPNLVPFNELPPLEQLKDYLFQTVVRFMRDHMCEQAVRAQGMQLEGVKKAGCQCEHGGRVGTVELRIGALEPEEKEELLRVTREWAQESGKVEAIPSKGPTDPTIS